MTIPPELRAKFRAHMKQADDVRLSLEGWMHVMLQAADAFLAEHHVDWEPRAALVYYLKVPYLDGRMEEREDGQANPRGGWGGAGGAAN